jgi:Bacterial Ig-like domain (group 3)/FG-GAP repeat
VGDFNGDGRLDLAVTNSTDNTISILRQIVAAPKVSVTLTSGQNPSSVNQPVTFTAVITASPYVLTGSVTFQRGANILGTVALDNGQASLTTTFTKAGTFPITAHYSGNGAYKPKVSTPLKQVVTE